MEPKGVPMLTLSLSPFLCDEMRQPESAVTSKSEGIAKAESRRMIEISFGIEGANLYGHNDSGEGRIRFKTAAGSPDFDFPRLAISASFRKVRVYTLKC